jgi:hypothetical protein
VGRRRGRSARAPAAARRPRKTRCPRGARPLPGPLSVLVTREPQPWCVGSVGGRAHWAPRGLAGTPPTGCGEAEVTERRALAGSFRVRLRCSDCLCRPPLIAEPTLRTAHCTLSFIGQAHEEGGWEGLQRQRQCRRRCRCSSGARCVPPAARCTQCPSRQKRRSAFRGCLNCRSSERGPAAPPAVARRAGAPSRLGLTLFAPLTPLRRAPPKRSALSASTARATARRCASRSRRWRSASTPSTSATSVARCGAIRQGAAARRGRGDWVCSPGVGAALRLSGEAACPRAWRGAPAWFDSGGSGGRQRRAAAGGSGGSRTQAAPGPKGSHLTTPCGKAVQPRLLTGQINPAGSWSARRRGGWHQWWHELRGSPLPPLTAATLRLSPAPLSHHPGLAPGRSSQ